MPLPSGRETVEHDKHSLLSTVRVVRLAARDASQTNPTPPMSSDGVRKRKTAKNTTTASAERRDKVLSDRDTTQQARADADGPATVEPFSWSLCYRLSLRTVAIIVVFTVMHYFLLEPILRRWSGYDTGMLSEDDMLSIHEGTIPPHVNLKI